MTLLPASGLNSDRTRVTVVGTGFQGGALVWLDTLPLEEVVVENATQLQASIPAGLPSGTYPLTVQNPDGTQGVLLRAFTVVAPLPPLVAGMSPVRGMSNVPVVVDLAGSNFAPGMTALLVGEQALPLEGVVFISSTQARAVVPPGLAPGPYSLKINTSQGSSTLLPDAYQVLAASSDDLYATAQDFWLDPATLRAGDTSSATLGLTVRRRGGQDALDTVSVRFYLGDPAAGGSLIGAGEVTTLLPNDSQSTRPVSGLPTLQAGTYTLYAVLDPEHLVAESDEAHNVISRTLTVLPPSQDDIAPQVEGFSTSRDTLTTSSPQLFLHTSARDNPGGVGVARLLFIEYEFVQSANDWMEVGRSEWLPYDEASDQYPWAIRPTAGTHYLQVWAADEAGNISPRPGTQFVTYLPDEAEVAQGEIHLYREFFPAGDSFLVRVTSLSGDADLLVWKPDGTEQGRSETSGATEEVRFSAETSGIWQMEVEGFTRATYRLEMVPDSPLAERSRAWVPQRGRGVPLSAPGEAPRERVALPAVPVGPSFTLYLPLLHE